MRGDAESTAPRRSRRRCAASASSASTCCRCTGRRTTRRAVEDYWSTLAALRDEGKVAHIGLSNHDVDAARAGGGDHPRRDAAAAVLGDRARLRRRRHPVVPRARHGRHRLLADAGGSAHRRVPAGAPRRPRPERLALRGRRVHRATSTATSRSRTRCARSPSEHGTSVAAVAIAWTLAWPGVTAAIVGARRADAGRRLDRCGRPRCSTTRELDTVAGAIADDGRGPGTGASLTGARQGRRAGLDGVGAAQCSTDLSGEPGAPDWPPG